MSDLTSQQAKMVQRAKDAITQAEARLEESKGDCRDCIHFRLGTIANRCVNPVVAAGAALQPQGYKRERAIESDYQRGPDDFDNYGKRFCGPSGFLFEARPTVLSTSVVKRFKDWWTGPVY